MSTPALRVWLTRYRQQQQLAQLQSLTAAAVAEGERVKALRAASAAVEIAHKHDVPEETPPIAAELIGLLQDAEVWTAILDGEVMPESGEFRIFDLVQLSHTEAGVTELAMTHGYGARRAVLSSMIPANGARISLVLSTTGEIAKRALWEAIVAAGVEGAVAKRLDAVYVPGTRSPSMVKMKITKDADVIVTSWERPDRTHGSATFAVYEDGALKEIGACSLIGKPNVEVGDVIEVEYLYVGAGDRLIQPRMKRRRTDKLAIDCTTEQLPSYSKASI